MGRDTPVAKAHPDWYQTRRLQGQDTTVIDMANPAAAQWVQSEVERVIETYGVEKFKAFYCSQDYAKDADAIFGCSLAQLQERLVEWIRE